MKKLIKTAVILICAVLVLSAAVGLFYRFFQYRPFKDLKAEDVEKAVIHSVGYDNNDRYNELSEDEYEKIVSLMSQLKVHLYRYEGLSVIGGLDIVEIKLKNGTEHSMSVLSDSLVEEGKDYELYLILNSDESYLLDRSNSKIFKELQHFVY